MYLILAIVAVLIITIILIYNSLVRANNQTQEAWSSIEVQLKRRHDLIPNVIETVKGYQTHEANVMQTVTQLRQQAMQVNSITDKAQAEQALGLNLNKLIAVSENYPDLKANTNFLELQKQLSDLEEQIQLSRRYYNGCVRDYNTKIQSFPTNLFANLFHFVKRDFFEADANETTLPTVNFSK